MSGITETSGAGSFSEQLSQLVDEMVGVLHATAKHFEGTDAPIGIAANAVLDKVRAFGYSPSSAHIPSE